MTIYKTHSHFGIYAFIRKDDAILLIEKARGAYAGLYDLPGGSPEEGELNDATLLREVKEETGLDVATYNKLSEQVITIFYPYVCNGENYLLKHSALLYGVENYAGTLKDEADGEDALGAKWVKISDISNMKCTPFVHHLLSDFT